MIPLSAIQDERDSGMDEDTIQQEFFVSYEAAIKGAYYGQQMKVAEAEGRIGRVPWEPSLPVDTCWDLGMDDANGIWILQEVSPMEIRALEYIEASGEGIEYYINELRKRPYVYRDHLAPHDIEVRELGTGVSRAETAKKLGVNFETVPRAKNQFEVMEGIGNVRNLLPRMWFDREGCGPDGINALKSYQKVWDSKRKCYQIRPKHDWASHAADSLRTYAMGRKDHFKNVSIVKVNTAAVGIDGWLGR